MKNQTATLTKRISTNNAVKIGTKNALKCSHGKAETPKHRYYKWKIVNFCWENDIHFTTEATLNNNGRADTVILDWGIIIEILISENPKNILEKDYPLPVVAFKPGKKTKIGTMNEYYLMRMLEELRDTQGSAADYYSERIFDEG